MWEFREDGCYVPSPLQDDESDTSQYIFLCDVFAVTEKVVDLLSGEEVLHIEILKDYGKKTFELKRSDTTKTKIFNRFIAQGLTIIDGDYSAGCLKEILLDLEKSAAVVFHHKELGFCNMADGTPVFLGYHPIGTLSKLQLASTHTNDKLVKPQGTFKKWRNFIMKECARSESLALALCLGATAPIANFLKQRGVFSEIPLWALISDSSTGKTSSLFLICSLMMNPVYGIHNFNATESAFHALIREHNGAYPFLCDEGSYTPKIDWDAMLYSLPAGSEKRRCNGDGSLRNQAIFSGALIITSEKSILERSMMIEGQVSRIVEFSLPWFKDGEQAERVKEFCTNNYGCATENIINQILDDKNSKKILKRFRKEYSNFLALVENNVNGVNRRLAQRMALILTSGWLLQKAVKIDFHLKAVKKILTQHFLTQVNVVIDSRTPAEKLYKAILGELASQHKRFPNETHVRDSSVHWSYNDVWGVRGISGNHKCVWIEENKFKLIIQKLSDKGFRTSCKMLDEAGVLKRSAFDRYLFEDISLGAFRGDCYCLILTNVPGIVESINMLPSGNRDIISLSRVLNDDPFGVYDPKGVDFAKDSCDSMKLEFSKITSTTVTLRINNLLYDALKLNSSDSLYLMPVQAKSTILISKTELIKGSLKLSLTKSSDGAWSDNVQIEKLLKLMKYRLQKMKKLIMIDIYIDNSNDTPVAIVDYDNQYGVYEDDIVYHNNTSNQPRKAVDKDLYQKFFAAEDDE